MCDNGTRGGTLDRPYSTRLHLVLYGYLGHSLDTIIMRTALPSMQLIHVHIYVCMYMYVLVARKVVSCAHNNGMKGVAEIAIQ